MSTNFLSRINTPEFQRLFTPELEKLKDIFLKNGYELRIAGGAVRDILLGKEPQDVDFATTATPEDMMDMFTAENIRLINSNGEKHGTVTCRMGDKENFEITTLRVDVKTDGRHAEVEFTKDWMKDAGRRDLTINSMFLGLDGTLYDYFNGQRDLMEKRVKFVGVPSERIKEDYLRILRYFRFYGRTSLEPRNHDPETLVAIEKNADGLLGISGERIWVELRKLTTGNHVDQIFKVMDEVNVLTKLGFTGNLNFDGLTKVWGDCKDMHPLPITIISSLLSTEDQIQSLHSRVKMSKEDFLTSSFILEHRCDEPFMICPSKLVVASTKSSSIESNENARGEYRESKKLKMELSEEALQQMEETGDELKVPREGETEDKDDDRYLGYCQDLLMATNLDVQKTRPKILELLKYLNLRRTHDQFQSWEIPRFPVSGLRLMERGFPKGPILSKELNRLKEIWRMSKFTKTEEELLQDLKERKSRKESS